MTRAKRLTGNQHAMLNALLARDWRVEDCTSGNKRTVNTLIEQGLAEIERVGGVRYLRITATGKERIRANGHE